METQKRPYQIMNSTTTNYLACGLEHFLFVHILGIVTPTDFHIFQRGWNHQPASHLSYSSTRTARFIEVHWLLALSVQQLCWRRWRTLRFPRPLEGRNYFGLSRKSSKWESGVYTFFGHPESSCKEPSVPCSVLWERWLLVEILLQGWTSQQYSFHCNMVSPTGHLYKVR